MHTPGMDCNDAHRAVPVRHDAELDPVLAQHRDAHADILVVHDVVLAVALAQRHSGRDAIRLLQDVVRDEPDASSASTLRVIRFCLQSCPPEEAL